MTLEQLVTDLATSQRLRDAGFPQDTALVWWRRVNNEPATVHPRSESLSSLIDCAAPTAGELEEWLMTFGFRELLTNKNPDDPIPERLWMVLASIHKEKIVQHTYGPTHVAAIAALVLELTEKHE